LAFLWPAPQPRRDRPFTTEAAFTWVSTPYDGSQALKFFRNPWTTVGGARAPGAKARHYLLSSALLMFAAAATAAEGCGDRKICIQSVPGSTGAELHAMNRESFPVTLLVDLTLNNLVPAGAMPAQWVLPPGEQVPLLRLQVADPQQSWDYSYRLSWVRGDFRVQHDDSYVYSLPYRPGSGFEVSQ